MKYIDSVTQYGDIILQTWLSNDGFTFIISEDNDRAYISIKDSQGYCTKCLYEKFIQKYNKYNVNFGGVMPPAIDCKRNDLEMVMKLLESINKNNLYYEDVR